MTTGGIRLEWTMMAGIVGLIAAGIASWVNINQKISVLEADITTLKTDAQRTNEIMTRELLELIKMVHNHAGHLNHGKRPQESTGGLPSPFRRGRPQ